MEMAEVLSGHGAGICTLEQLLKGFLLIFIGSLVAGNKAEHKTEDLDANPPCLPSAAGAGFNPEWAQRGPSGSHS